MPLTLPQRLQYFTWCLARSALRRQQPTCPSCDCADSTIVKRKYLVTSLAECRSCGLRYRLPKEDDESQTADFYQEEYSEGFTTDCPDPDALATMLATNFADTEKDFIRYIRVLRECGLALNDPILDFGCSWGYGSWQLRNAGYRVYSFDISRRRLDYARNMLGCTVISSPEHLPEPVTCVFSAHVIEHLANPNSIWALSDKVLTPEGFIACFCPNGNPQLEKVRGPHWYHQRWGKVHPLYITPRFLAKNSERYGYTSCVCSSPFELSLIKETRNEETPNGEELVLIARRRPGILSAEGTTNNDE